MAERRPFRVVFTPSVAVAQDDGRIGTIVVRDLDTAHREARGICCAGGCAEVRYIGEDGSTVTVAVYHPAENPG